MKRFLIVALILLSLSCKKDNASEDITAYNWMLKTQVVSPAIKINGKTSTDYLSLQNPEGCTKNFTYGFMESGVFTVSSNGALCDMVANSDQQKWEKNGDQLKLDFGSGMIRTLTVQKNSMIQTANITVDGANYTLTSTYTAQKN